MKRFALLILSIWVMLAALAPQPVFAAPTKYARAAVRTAYFFNEKNTSSCLFAVPYTYCIEVLREDSDWYYAKYANDAGIYKALYGYCRKQDFTVEEGVPETTYLYKTVVVNYSVNGGSPSLPVLGEISLDAAYYGTFYSGATVYSYVYCQGSFGYIEGANDDYPLNTPATDDGGDTQSGQNGKEKGSVSFALIAFIVIALLFTAVIIVIYLATKKPRSEA